jgi:DNA processing protein
VTSPASAGCHEIIRSWGAVCVTSAADVLECTGLAGEDLADRRRGPVLDRDALDRPTALVLDAIPARGGAGPATIAATAGVDVDTAIRCLGALAAGGFIERCDRGWQLRHPVR